MIRHDHRPPSVPTGNDNDKISLVAGSFLILQPAAGPGKIEVGFPLERQLAGQGLVFHLGGGDDFPIIGQ